MVVKNRRSFREKIKAMMADDPLLIAIKSQTKEQVIERLKKLGVLDEKGNVSDEYRKKFRDKSIRG